MLNLLAIFTPGPLELSIIAGIIILLFGSAKVPSLMRNLGRGVTEFKKGVSGTEAESDAKSDDNT